MRAIKGNAHVYGDHINTDLIIPTPYLRQSSEAMGPYCFIDHDPSFAKRVRAGDIVVAGVNFGCGSTKPGANALLGAGIACVVAKSFGRIFFRNAINAGLLVVECPALVDVTEMGDIVTVDFDTHTCKNETKGVRHEFAPYPPLIGEIIEAGGIVNLVRGQQARGGQKKEETPCAP